MAIQRILSFLLTFFTLLGLSWNQPAIAALPPGNAIKDPYAILRTALPLEQQDLRELQKKLEDTSDALRGKRWPTLEDAAYSTSFQLNRRKNAILDELPATKQKEGEQLLNSLAEDLDGLIKVTTEKNKTAFIDKRQKSLEKIGDLEALVLKEEFPYKIPEEFNDLPRLLGRADVSIETSKGKMLAVIDGYNAPLTAGSFIDLSLKGFYDGLPFSRAEDFYVLQTGDPEGSEIGYIDPKTNTERHVPLEIRVTGEAETLYNETFEEVGLFTQAPVLPFATLGTLGWAHSGQALDDGSSQFFFFLYEAELNPAGKNLIDGRNAAFGYIIEGSEVLNKLGIDDRIISIKVINGADRLKQNG